MSVRKIGKASLIVPQFWLTNTLITCGVEGTLDMFVSPRLISLSRELFRGESESKSVNWEESNEEIKERANKISSDLRNESFLKPIPLYILKRDPIRPEQGSSLIYCLYKDNMYKFDRAGYSEEEMLLQIMDLEDEERRKFERLKKKFSQTEEIEREGLRESIPEETRIAVWRRDEGKCVKCGGREKLEYDHIIPVSKGGGNTVRNIELLCERCNRAKANKIL
ncbi:MAG: hypothetical protein A2787_00485 [Omnitrophica WOR_2 bacterium RIFCSPHIGHO2_01_FULL_48_9]|nr:MAG: hypothetical protein A3D10_00105 [Omnitrophica WOR_2 bacterium RIFCSPHIGHO2_02_FULL_48_11]OGX33610.1 MAG: hypothetical protein A2787_00485 [Omnitrophica WOR_2 bacterium RIFCSPHIGHO2_01_FULL_48_9]